MRRVLVIGCPGAGKSTLTRALAETLGLPAVYLDRLWWKSGWINRTRAEFDARLDAALAGDAWVMDGNYSLPASSSTFPNVPLFPSSGRAGSSSATGAVNVKASGV